jgi:hypothetical protein
MYFVILLELFQHFLANLKNLYTVYQWNWNSAIIPSLLLYLILTTQKETIINSLWKLKIDI